MSLHRTTVYHPQSNGMVERMHRTMKSALRARLITECRFEDLPWVQLRIQMAPKLDLDCSPSSLALRHSPQRLGELLQREPVPSIPKIIYSSIHSPCNTALLPGLDTCLHIFVQDDSSHRPLQPPYLPGAIQGTVSFKQDDGIHGHLSVISIEWCKLAFLSDCPDSHTVVTRSRHPVTRLDL